MDNNLFIKNILILIFCVILIHIFLNDFLNNKTCNNEPFQQVKTKTLVYLFYADWCGHCKLYKPIFNKFKKQIEKNKQIKIIEINADEKRNDLYNKYNIEGFPTTIIHKNKKITKLVGVQTLSKLLKETINIEHFNAEFNTENPDIFQKNDDTIIYNFNTTWCKHSKDFQPIWNKFSDAIKTYENVKAIDVKCDLDENINFCNKFKIESVPSIIIVKNNELKPFEGSRTVEGLMNELKLTLNDKALHP